MKYLYLMRHGQAEPQTNATHDEKRVLTETGLRQIKEITLLFKEKVPTIDKIMTSPAVRARQTAECVAREMSFPLGNIEIDKKLYGEIGAAGMVRLFSSTDDKIQRLLIIGHNPVMEALTILLCPLYHDRLPPGGLVAIAL